MHLLALLSLLLLSVAGDPRAVLAKAMIAMGGAHRLQAIHAIEYTAVGERQMAEQSERPTGPYFIDHFRLREIRDFADNRARSSVIDEAYAADRWWTTQRPQQTDLVINGPISAAVSGKTFTYAGAYGVQENDELSAFAPERILATALRAPDLHLLPDEYLHGVRHYILSFRWRGAPCELAINADANLPWRITYTRPYPYQTFLNAWGDVRTEITYSAWSYEKFGVSYPREWTYRRLGLPDRQLFIVDLRINPALNESELTIPAQIRAVHRSPLAVDDEPLGARGSGAAHDLAPGITEVPGGWNVVFVKQSDGLVMIEAPWSTGYTKRALQAARKRYRRAVSAVITTSDSWPHIAGVRQAVAQSITVYALDLNRPILTRMITASHTMRPDDLQLHPRAPHMVFVTRPMTIGSGPNRLVMYPYRTETAERQMMVFFPQRRLLYTSDLFSLADGPHDWFTPQYLKEATSAIERYALNPVTVFGMHYDATPYSQLLNDLKAWTKG